MKQVIIYLEVDDNFEKGDCTECPLNVIDWSNSDDGFPSSCQLGCKFQDCPIIFLWNKDSIKDPMRGYFDDPGIQLLRGWDT